MKNVKTISRLTALLLAVIMVFTMLVACNEEPPAPAPVDPDTGSQTPTPPASIVITMKAEPSVSTIAGEETVKVVATVEGTDNKAVTFTTEPAGILNVTADGVVSIAPDANLTRNKKVTVIATSVEDGKVTAAKSFIVQAPVKEGQVGELTSDMLQAIGNASISVTGTVVDYYQDLLQAANSYEMSYDTFVKMVDGKWVGTWNATPTPDNPDAAERAVTEFYRRDDVGAEVQDVNGEWGKAIEKIYIGKDNTMVASPVKNNRTSVLWDSQHLWNHLGELDVNRFSQIEDTNEYEYTLDPTDVDDLYFMTYISYFLTPMMTETMNKLIVTVENGAITKMVAETEKIYRVGSEVTDTSQDAESLSYTIATFTFSDIGTTVVEDPVGYEAPEYAEKLSAALEALKNATNYTYSVVDVTTQAPSTDSGDYEMEMSATASSGATMMETLSTGFPYTNYKSASGTVGEIGFVVDGNIVIAKTGQYSYSMDGKNYHTEYYGYKDNGNNTYDEFYYDPDAQGFVGDKIWLGNVKDNLQPSFVLSANIFEFGSYDARNGLYTFYLREGAATADVAKVLSPYYYAKNAASSISESSLKLVVTEQGTVKQVVYSYNINDMYYGYFTIDYKNIGTTVFQTYGSEENVKNVFDNYIPRVIPTSWSAFTDDDYYYLHTTLCENYGGCQDADGNWDHSAHTKTVDVIISELFGEDAASVPSPDVFTNAFGDTMSTAVGYNWKDGEVAGTYVDYLAFNLSCDDYERNDNYYEDAIARITEALYELGFTIDNPNTDTVGKPGAYSDRTISFVKEGNPGVQIVIENNRTAHFFVRIYKAGEWKLK